MLELGRFKILKHHFAAANLQSIIFILILQIWMPMNHVYQGQ